MNCWDDNNKLSKYILIVQVEGKREGWGDGKDLSLALFFLCVAVSISVVFHTLDLIVCLVVAANTDSNVITCSVLCNLCWF